MSEDGSANPSSIIFLWALLPGILILLGELGEKTIKQARKFHWTAAEGAARLEL